MIITTKSGSRYEIDRANSRARTLHRENPGASVRLSADGQWRTFSRVSNVQIGAPVMFIWTTATPLLPGSQDGAVPMTTTSNVVSLALDLGVLECKP
jgi:hypothetical protein